MLSRYYIQCDRDTDIADWPDDPVLAGAEGALPALHRGRYYYGAVHRKSIAPLRSFVAEPMSYGRLYLAGDAAHIVPPTGAKGLNLAISDVYYLSRALASFYNDGDSAGLGRLFTDRVEAGLGRGAHLLVPDQPVCTAFRTRVSSTCACRRTKLETPGEFRGRAAQSCRAVHRHAAVMNLNKRGQSKITTDRASGDDLQDFTLTPDIRGRI